MKIQAVVFDLDGTLLDTLTDLTASVNYALTQMGHAVHTKDEVCSYVGTGVRVLMTRALPQGASDAAIDECLGLFSAHYKDHMDDATAPYPGVLDMLDGLNARGIKVGILSNKVDVAVKALSARYFGERVTLAVGERPGVKRKPAPDALFDVLSQLGVAPENAVYVGDSDVDVQTAQNARVSLVAVSWGFRPEAVLRDAGATTIIDRADQLIPAIGL